VSTTGTELRDHLEATLGGAYKVKRELGGGGMSRVFVAEDARLGRHVVIKVLHPDLAADVSAARFEREVHLAARLQHPHIVPLFTAGEAGGLLYYTMPYVEGESLRQWLAREGSLPVSDVLRLMRELADALDYAHGQGVVHRDLKPENVLLSGRHATIADFGVAKALSAATTARPVTATNAVLGTPLYMAPEQAAADPTTDHRADLYALGLIAYELLAGAHPFGGRSPQAVLAAHLTEEPAPLAERRPDVPPTVDALIARLLAKRPEDRPQTSAEVVRVLDEIPTSAGAPPPAVAWTPRAGHRGAFAALAVATLVVLAALGTFVLKRPSATERPILVVLPFENLGPASDEYFADGLTDEVTSRLAGVSGLRVIGRASARQYKGTTKGAREIARELGATHLLTGTVRWDRAGGGAGRVRVSPELVRAADQASVWAEPYEGPLEDVFRVQASVAERVAAALDVALLTRERRAVTARPTANIAAYDAYLRGRASSTRLLRYSVPSQRAAIAEFNRAIDLDPRFAAAYARLADSYLAVHDVTGDPAMLANARTSSERAWAIDSTLLESQLARARYLAAADDPEGAYRVVSTAAAAAPGDVEVLFRLAETEAARGRPERALASALRAAALDPRSDPWQPLAGLYERMYRYEEAVRTREREIALAPQNTAAYFVQAGTYLLWSADTLAARRTIERAGPTIEIWLIRLPGGIAAGPATWRHVLPPSVLQAKDTLTLAGYLTVGGFPPELFYLMKARHFALAGRTERARFHADSLVRRIEPALRQTADVRFVAGVSSRRAALAEAYAYLGRTADAAREIDRYVSEARSPRNATILPRALVNAAYVDVLAGRHDVAVGRLEEALELPAGESISRALLRADSSWAPLRAHPRFARLVAGG
jgi:TolB-like protein/tRNA A-37 threonylcarbamoyl transferase component Bud32